MGKMHERRAYEIRSANAICGSGQRMASDSDESLHKRSAGLDTICGARAQTRAKLATCRQRLGDALHRWSRCFP
jgi:hypothetical protein